MLFFLMTPKNTNFGIFQTLISLLMKRYSFVKPAAILIIHSLVLLNTTLGQEPRKFRINILSGYALPQGQLASKHFDNGGYAVYGAGSALEGIWKFHPHLSAGVSFSVSKFPFDENTYAQNLVDSDPFMDNLYMKSDAYKVLTYTGAIYYTGSICNKVRLTGNVGGGIVWAQTPDQLFSATYFGGIKRTYKITPAYCSKPVITTGLSCKYRVFEQVDISLFANYYLANLGFSFLTSSDSYTRWLTFSYINTGLGIGFVF